MNRIARMGWVVAATMMGACGGPTAPTATLKELNRPRLVFQSAGPTGVNVALVYGDLTYDGLPQTEGCVSVPLTAKVNGGSVTVDPGGLQHVDSQLTFSEGGPSRTSPQDLCVPPSFNVPVPPQGSTFVVELSDGTSTFTLQAEEVGTPTRARVVSPPGAIGSDSELQLEALPAGRVPQALRLAVVEGSSEEKVFETTTFTVESGSGLVHTYLPAAGQPGAMDLPSDVHGDVPAHLYLEAAPRVTRCEGFSACDTAALGRLAQVDPTPATQVTVHAR